MKPTKVIAQKKFKINKNSWVCKIVKDCGQLFDVGDNIECFGMTVFPERAVYLSKTYNKGDVEIPLKFVEETLWHELAHTIIFETHFNEQLQGTLKESYETFIDSLGSVLKKTFKSPLDD